MFRSKELYFIQQLAEFTNNPDNNIILLTTVHQNFDAYAIHLQSSQRQEWTKVKGRFKEITFNEPVEQLLFLASEHKEEKQSIHKKENTVSELVELLTVSKAFNTNEDYIKAIAKKLYPLDARNNNCSTGSLKVISLNLPFTFVHSCLCDDCK